MNHDIEINLHENIDIFAKDGKCPICNSELSRRTPNRSFIRYCKNECYKFDSFINSDGSYEYVLSIFGFDFNVNVENRIMASEAFETISLDIKKEIFYWKENERYLAKIMIDS